MSLGANRYGKAEVRLVKVERTPGRHVIRDLTVDVALEGDFAAAHLTGDNTGLLATDTMRNTVYALAPEHLPHHVLRAPPGAPDRLDRSLRARAGPPLRGGGAERQPGDRAHRGAP